MPDFQPVMIEGKGQRFSQAICAPFVSFLFEHLGHFAQQQNSTGNVHRGFKAEQLLFIEAPLHIPS